jgi:uncharacterized protein YciI
MFFVIGTWHRPWDLDNPLLIEHSSKMRQKIEEGRFLCTGRLDDGSGGILIDYGDDEAELRDLLDDEFQRQGYISYEIIKFAALMVDPSSSLPKPPDDSVTAVGFTGKPQGDG